MLLLALLTTEPAITHQDLTQVCPPGSSVAAYAGAPLGCLMARQGQTMAALTRSLKSLQRQLEFLLKHSAPELK